MASKNSKDLPQKVRMSKKELEHQNYRRQKEAEKLKEELMVKLKEEAEREQKRLGKKAKEREKVESLKQESLVEQVSVILNGKKKTKHVKTEMSADVEPEAEVGVRAKSDDDAWKDDGVVGDSAWNDDGMWGENYSSFSNAATAVDEIWDEPEEGKQRNEPAKVHKEDRRHKNQHCKNERSFYPSGTSYRTKSHVGLDDFSKNSRGDAYRENKRNYSNKRNDNRHPFQNRKQNVPSHNFRKNESKLHCESTWDEPDRQFQRASHAIDAPAPEVNVWKERQSKMETIEQLKPHNDYEEEAMLHQALELSRRQAVEDQKRRNDFQEAYCMQLKYISENPEFAAHLEDEVDAGAAAAPSNFKDDSYGWDDDKDGNEIGDEYEGSFSKNFRERKFYNRDTYNLDYSYEKTDVYSSAADDQKHEYRGAKPKYKQSKTHHDTWDDPLTTNKVIFQGGDDDGIWGNVDDKADLTEDTVAAASEEINQTEQPAKCVRDSETLLKLPSEVISDHVVNQTDLNECEESSLKQGKDCWLDDNNTSLDFKEKILHKKEGVQETSNFKDANVDMYDESQKERNYDYIPKSPILVSKESKSNTYPVEDPLFFNYSCSTKNFKKLRDYEHDSWDEDLDHMLKSVKGISLSSEPKSSIITVNGVVSKPSPKEKEAECENCFAVEPKEPAVTRMTVKAVSALQGSSTKNAMSNVEEWLASTQSETLTSEHYNIGENLSETENSEANTQNINSGILSENDSPVVTDQHMDLSTFVKPPASGQVEEQNDSNSVPSPFVLNPTENSASFATSGIPNSIPENSTENLRQISSDSSSTFGMPFMSQPYPTFGPPVLPPAALPLNPATATSSYLWQHALMCSNPFLMQQLQALQMYYMSLGVLAPNGFLPSPAVLPGQPNLLPQTPFESIQSQQLASDYNASALPSAASYQFDAHLPPQYIPNSQIVSRAINPPVHPTGSSRSSSSGKTVNGSTLPPGINTNYFQPQTELSDSMKLHSHYDSPRPHTFTGGDDYVGIPPPRPVEKSTGTDSLRQPRHKFNDLCPLLEQSSINQTAQNHTVPKGSEQMF